ncbi:hypothetical protein O7626_40460 [Micromonospora sp. WMMD1102]|uniref:hypothetical protein n=1 Tax=Micromonospora sp. WMMD1102 TaxID=3016105 RepID=UPI002414DF3A|nr:hypothetical protein [Micromonospora sp. WMMD1102]MDG4792092.1 hypothetical protein [Micromonospora sp. WMMD1102]
MTRMTIALPDDLADRIKAAGGDNVSAWMQRAARDALLREEVAAVSAFERRTSDPDWDAEREQEWAA